jgi:hypothetical protein
MNAMSVYTVDIADIEDFDDNQGDQETCSGETRQRRSGFMEGDRKHPILQHSTAEIKILTSK